ncbi:hypothetical protein [Sphaerisporangium fuscum]|nr:hypothetical protein [Sphaerisporangium fuscum]
MLLGIGGVTSLRGATLSSRDAQSLVHTLASAMGVTIEERPGLSGGRGSR